MIRFVLPVVVAAICTYVAWRFSTKRDRAIGNAPAAAINDDTPFIEQATDNWILARRAVHSLSRVINNDDIWPLIPSEDLIKARKVIADFNKQEEE